MTSNYKRGYAGERRVVMLYRNAGWVADRNRQDTPNHNLPDVTAGPFSIEVKKGTGKGTYSSKMLDKVMDQARLNQQEGSWPVAHIWDGRGSERYVVLFEPDWMELTENYRVQVK